MYGYNWEHLGFRNKRNPKAFITESDNGLLHVLSLHKNYFKKSNENDYRMKIISMEQFVIDIKLIVIGIQSDTFYYDKLQHSFKMLPNLTINNVSPGVIEHFIKQFLECGNYYKNLRFLITKNNHKFNLKHHGFVFKVIILFLQIC